MSELTTVAALYVEENGVYAGLPGVDVWGISRDARKYAGPWPVVAHPPCARWCRLAGLVEARWGHKRGDDGGCFAAALGAVRDFGGVLEHPAYSDAWPAHGLPAPKGPGWQFNIDGTAVAYVEQGRYGHPAKESDVALRASSKPAPAQSPDDRGQGKYGARVLVRKPHVEVRQAPESRQVSRGPHPASLQRFAALHSPKRHPPRLRPPLTPNGREEADRT